MMTKEKLADLQQQGQAAVDAARGIAEAAQAENRPMSGSEQAAYDLEMKAASAKLVEIRSAKDDLAVIDKAREISEAIGGPLHGESGSMGGGTDSRRLSFKGMGRQVAARLLDGTKALAPSGATVVAQEFQGDPIPSAGSRPGCATCSRSGFTRPPSTPTSPRRRAPTLRRWWPRARSNRPLCWD